MIYLTIITIVSMLISFFSLRFAGESWKEATQVLERHLVRLGDELERQQKLVEIIESMLKKQKGGAE